mmetsp:Transcript_27022/g.31442  ORF Transcript_27022/g.31442 Transcript_27022/m.31442 type:complete len:84 (+) Transcript_27022:688-939(+)
MLFSEKHVFVFWLGIVKFTLWFITFFILQYSDCYKIVVSRESVRIAFTYAALNELPVMAADIRNAYLQARTSEKHYSYFAHII